MKSMTIVFEDEEMAHIEQIKAKRSWRQFILDMTEYEQVRRVK